MNGHPLDSAFRATSYRIETDEGVFTVRIARLHCAFDAYLRRKGASCWGLLTAYNPGAIRCAGQNAAQHERLRERLKARGWTVLPALNVPDDAAAPVEPGFLLLQASEKEVAELAADFAQVAFVCGNIGASARLIYVADRPLPQS